MPGPWVGDAQTDQVAACWGILPDFGSGMKLRVTTGMGDFAPREFDVWDIADWVVMS